MGSCKYIVIACFLPSYRRPGRGAHHSMLSNVLFHLILLAYLFASLLFWLHLSLRQHWLLQVACILLGSGFGLQTGLLGFLLYTQRFLLRDNMAASMALLSWAIVAVYFVALWRYRIAALAPLLSLWLFLRPPMLVCP